MFIKPTPILVYSTEKITTLKDKPVTVSEIKKLIEKRRAYGTATKQIDAYNRAIKDVLWDLELYDNNQNS